MPSSSHHPFFRSNMPLVPGRVIFTVMIVMLNVGVIVMMPLVMIVKVIVIMVMMFLLQPNHGSKSL